MIAGEVAYHFFEEQERRQIQIYPDAADMGIRLRNDEHKAQFRDHLRDLMSIYKYQLNKWEYGSSTSLFVPYECEDGIYFGVRVEVSWHRDTHRPLEFISIFIERGRTAINPFQE